MPHLRLQADMKADFRMRRTSVPSGTNQGLWDSLPPVYQQHAAIYTDFWKSYNEVFPPERHIPVGKNTGKTSYIERFNNTMRQRISRPVRKTLSFSKKLENHTAAIWLFVHHCNSVIKKEITTAT